MSPVHGPRKAKNMQDHKGASVEGSHLVKVPMVYLSCTISCTLLTHRASHGAQTSGPKSLPLFFSKLNVGQYNPDPQAFLSLEPESHP